MEHPYTTESLAPDAPSLVVRVPGVREVTRLFPEPSSVGRGSLRVEGGVTLVGGPGMGKTTLLRQLVRSLEAERGIAAALVTLPPAEPYAGEAGFHRYLAALVRLAIDALRRSPLLGTDRLEAVREALREPAWDGGGAAPALTPRGLEAWLAGLGSAAARCGGACLLLDEADRAFAGEWKVAFVGALRFAFQASAGVTPIYAAWKLYVDESLPGSNYFRNVTRPIFLEPLAARPREAGGRSERRALLERGLAGLAPAAAERLERLAGGHPRLLQRVLADLCERLDGASPARLDAAAVDALLAGAPAEGQRALAAGLLSGSEELAAALRALAAPGAAYPYRSLSKVLVASGLVDQDERGQARVPERVREAL